MRVVICVLTTALDLGCSRSPSSAPERKEREKEEHQRRKETSTREENKESIKKSKERQERLQKQRQLSPRRLRSGGDVDITKEIKRAQAQHKAEGPTCNKTFTF